MDWLMHAVEKDLGIDRRQQSSGPRPRELVALVPSRWVLGLRDRRVIRCARFDSISETEIGTYLHCPQAKLPPGWSRVCIQGLQKSKVSYRLARDPHYHQTDFQDSFIKTMQCVSQHNVRNLWREAHYKLVQPYAGPSEQMHVAAVDAVRHALQKLFNTTFISSDKVSPSLSPAREKDKENCFSSTSCGFSKSPSDHLCPNVLPVECLLETADMLYVVLPYTQYSLHDIVSFSPAKLANSHAKVLFILYQVLKALQACHAAGLSCGELSLQDIAVDEQLCSRLKLSLAHYEDLGMEGDAKSDVTGIQDSKNILRREVCMSQENKRLCEDCFGELKTLVLDWVHGRVSNFRYLMELNRLAGRRDGDPNYHPVLPWVVDFTTPFGKFRDLRRSKFRLNKGDKQLDFTYEMTKEALAAAGGNGVVGGSVGGDLSTSVGTGGAGQSDHLHVPHHISDVLSDITYYVYKARQTPKSVLCSHVRSQWEPNEYPASMERMQSWTPDECIPEFYTDPTIFRSIHPDMPDLDVPSWCKSCEEFIEVHRHLLESREVSQHLHHWIDLTFGYKLSGKEAVKAKNVCLHLVDNHTNLTTYGVVQLFDQPHPPRLSPSQYAPAEPPLLGLAALNVPSLHIPQIDTVADTVDGMVPESTGCESSGWTMVDKDEELEQGMEALDSLASAGSASSTSSSVPLPNIASAGGKVGVDNTALIVSQSPGDFTSGLGPGLRSAMLQRGGQTNKKHIDGSVSITNTEEIKISLPEGFSPLQPLEELEKLNNFLVKSLHAEVWHPASESTRESMITEALPSLTQLYQRDMQALGVVIAELFYSSKLRGLKPGAPLRQRFQAIMKLCSASLRDVPLSLHHALETLLLIEKHSGSGLTQEPDCPRPLLFKYDPINDGLPPPNPCQLLNSVITPFPFPPYFASLHQFIFSYHTKMETACSLQGRDVVFHLWQQLETLLRGNITAEGLEILLPFILALMLEESTAIYAAWYLFEPISRVLGPRNASKYLLKPLINVYENPHYLRGRFYLYTDCFILQLIVRLGLQAFLSSLLPHVLQVITGFESCDSETGGDACKGLRAGTCNLGEEEEEEFQCGKVRSSSGSVTGNMGSGSGASGGVGVVGDTGLVDYSSGISLNDQVFLTEAEDFQNGFYVNSGTGVAAGKQQNQNATSKDQDQESLSVGKLSDKSSTSELSLGDGDSMRDRASLKSADSSQDLKQASEGEEGGEMEEEEVTETESKEQMSEPPIPNLEPTLSGCTEASGTTVATLEGEFVNGMVMDETDKGVVGEQEEEDDNDPSEESEEKEQKILLDTVCKTVRWLSAKLGPTVTSRYVARNLLRLLTNCYIGLKNHQFVAPASEDSGAEGVSMGSVYEKKPVVGDETAGPVLDCLIYIAQLYGEPVLTYQYLPYIGYLVSPPSSQRLNTRKEASLLGAVALTQKIIVFLSDTTLMDMLMKINQDVLLPLLDLLTTPRMGFPSGVQTRTAVCLKTLSLMALICLRIGREMVQQHMADTLRRFFAIFSLLHTLQPQLDNAPRRIVGEVTVVDVCTPDESNVTYELGVLEELQTVFNPEMAHASYIPFYCLIGDTAIRKLVPNHELVWQLAQSYHQSVSQGSPQSNLTTASRAEAPPSSISVSSGFGRRALCNPFPAPSASSAPLGDSLPESGTFGSHLVGNRIQVSQDHDFSSSPNLASSWGRSSHTGPIITTASTFTTPSSGTASFSSSWVTGHTPEDSALKQELPRSGRSLQGNWLAYWQYEIGLNQQDPHFHFHQIRLQSFLGHSGTTKCLAPLAGEDYFLSGSKDKTVKLWPLYNHGDGTQEVEPRLTYAEHRKSVFYVGQLEASQEVVSCDGTVHLWDQYTGKQIRSYEAVDGKNPITAVTTMPAPHCSVVFGSADSVLRFIDPRKPGLQHEFRLAYNNVSAGLIRYLAVSPAGRTVAAGFSSGFIVLLDARTGLVLKGWPAHEGDILQMKAADGNLVISSSTDYSLTVWKDLEHKPLRQYKSQSDPIHAFDLYGSEIVTGTVANKIGVYSMADISLSPISSTKLSSENFRGTLTSLAVLPTKRLLLLGSENGAIRLLA